MYKKFFLNIIFLIGPLAILILFVNITVDSGSAVNNRSKEIAEIIISGKNAGIKYVPSNWGSLQTEIVSEQLKMNKTSRKDILVFGTSRSSEINSNIFKDNTFFNCVVPGGNILDYIALYGLYKQNNILPQYLIISIDPWTFHSRKGITVNKEIQYVADTTVPLSVNKDLLDNFKNGTNFLDIKHEIANNLEYMFFSFDFFSELFSPTYFQINMRLINSKVVIKTDTDCVPNYFVIRNDGGYSLAQQSEIDSNSVIKKSNEFVAIHKSNFFLPCDTISIYFEYFKKLLNNLKIEGVIPIVYISPVNPLIYDKLSISMKVAIEDKIVLFCKQKDIVVIGSFNPNKYGYILTTVI